MGDTLTRAGSFTDPGPDIWTATVNYGDGSGVQPLPLNPDKTFTLSHTYTAGGTFTVNATVQDYDGGSGFASFVVTVNAPPTANAGGPYSVAEGGTVALDGTASSDPNQSATTVTYAWDLDGDGVFGETGAAAGRGNETGSLPTFSAAGIANLTNGSGSADRLNGSYFLVGDSTVFDDTSADILRISATDWVFADPYLDSVILG